MKDIMRPLDAKSDGLVESMKDPTSAEGMIFFHADEGKPLATPWQVAISRAILLNQKTLPEGHILDCACGSGIQIAAYSAIFKRPALGIELNPQRARARAVNFRNIFKTRGGDVTNILQKSLFLAADGRDGTGAIEKLETANNEPVSYTHLTLPTKRIL